MISCRALRFETQKQINFEAGLTLKSFASQFLCGSISRGLEFPLLVARLIWDWVWASAVESSSLSLSSKISSVDI